MSVAHPFQSTANRSSLLARRRHRSVTEPVPHVAAPAPSALRTAATRADVARPRVTEAVIPGTRTPAGLPRDLVVDEAGKPRRSVLLAAIMIRRGRSVAEISQATGLAPEVVACLSKSV